MDKSDAVIELKEGNNSFEIKSMSETDKYFEFEGYASKYGIVDQAGDVTDKGCFDRTIAMQGKSYKLLYHHQTGDVPLGKAEVKADEVGLQVHGYMLKSIQKSREVYDLMKEGIVDGLSYGFNAIKKEYKSGIRHLQEVRLRELTVTPWPCQLQATVYSVKSQVDFETALAVVAQEAKAGKVLKASNLTLAQEAFDRLNSLDQSDEAVKAALTSLQSLLKSAGVEVELSATFATSTQGNAGNAAADENSTPPVTGAAGAPPAAAAGEGKSIFDSDAFHSMMQTYTEIKSK